MSRKNLKSVAQTPATLPFRRKATQKPPAPTTTGEVVELTEYRNKRDRRSNSPTYFARIGVIKGEVAEGTITLVAMMDGTMRLAWCGETFGNKEKGTFEAEFAGIGDDDINFFVGRVVVVTDEE